MKYFIILFFAFNIFSSTDGLVLNGKGKRLATIFKVKVYEASLYLPKKSSKLTDVISMSGKKVLEMKFLRDVGKKKIIEGFKEGMKNNKLPDAFEKIYGTLSDVKKGDLLTFVFTEGLINFKHKKSIEIKASDSSRYLKLWLDKVPNKELKKGLLAQ